MTAPTGKIDASASAAPIEKGDWLRQYAALTTGAGIVDFPDATIVEHTGPDALDLVHRLSTADLLDLEDGQARDTVLTSDRGRVVDVFTVVRLDAGRLLLLSDFPPPAPLLVGIDRYTIIEDARLNDVSGRSVRMALIGPAAPGVSAAITGGKNLIPGQALVTPVSGTDVLAVRRDWPLLPRVDFVVARESATVIKSILEDAGAVAAGERAFHAARIASGVPHPGAELSEDVNPLEAGLEHLVSFTKGCYVGQEVIARLDAYDKLQRRLMKFSAPANVAQGLALTSGGKRAGHVTSLSPAPDGDGFVGLALVRKRFWEDGSEIMAGENTPITVFVPPSQVLVGTPGG